MHKSLDPFDVPVVDTDRLEEIELVTALIIAANQCDGRLSQLEIDRALGIS